MNTNYRSLSRNEMKNIKGGFVDPQACHCTCEGGKGAWTYVHEPPATAIKQDIKNYCPSGAATCGGCINLK